jgi:23S rRNA pseudouridine955/2504/2580 synthase
MIAQGKTRTAARRGPPRPVQAPGAPVPAQEAVRTVPQVSRIRIGPEHDGQRVDNFLLRWARGVPKSHVYRVLRSGEVRVNGSRVRAERRLVEGDEVRIPPLRLAAAPRTGPAPALSAAILFEDEHLLVLDKPSGVAVHGGSGVAHGVIERVRAARPELPMLELVHRLDRETSGVLMLAKTRRGLVGVQDQMRAGSIRKRYLAVVAGDWVNDRQHVRARLLRTLGPEGERRVLVDEQSGVEAHTIFNLQARLDGFSLLEAELLTGRTHQIRVHLQHLGFPILGDDRYGNFELNRRAARGEFGPRLARMFLHARHLELRHPADGRALAFEAALPPECADWLAARTPRAARGGGRVAGT